MNHSLERIVNQCKKGHTKKCKYLLGDRSNRVCLMFKGEMDLYNISLTYKFLTKNNLSNLTLLVPFTLPLDSGQSLETFKSV